MKLLFLLFITFSLSAEELSFEYKGENTIKGILDLMDEEADNHLDPRYPIEVML